MVHWFCTQAGVLPGGLSLLSGFRSLLHQVSYDVPALRGVHGNLLHSFHPVMTGEERAMVDPAQESGDGRCIDIIQLEMGAELLHGNPLLGLSDLFHVLFE